MDPHSYPLVSSNLPSFGSTMERALSYSEDKKTIDCDDWIACVQGPFNRKSSGSFSIRLLSALFTSLAVVYFLLRCFDLTRGQSRLTPLTRSLAAGDRWRCVGDGENDGNRRVGENVGREESWIESPEGSDEERLTGEAPSGHSPWGTGGTVGWPSVPTTRLGGSGGTHEFASRVGLEGVASTLGSQTSQAQDDALLEYSLVRQVFGSELGIPAPHVGGDTDRQSFESRFGTPRPVKLRPGETLGMWERRNLPSYAEDAVISLFQRMIEVASLSRSLLRTLSQRQRLYLAREVVRLLTLELGAFSLVKEHLEPLRSKLGSALIRLSNEALQRSGQDTKLEESRAHLRALVVLLGKLTQPRPASEKSFAALYRTKMISLLRTAGEVVNFCESVIEGLDNFEAVMKCKPPSDLVTQQLRVLKGLYEAHSSYVARDSTLRFFIIECQESIGSRPILSKRHHNISSYGLPPVRESVEEIHRAVKDAGGFPQPLPQLAGKHQNSSPTLSTTTQQQPTSHKAMGEELRLMQQQRGFVPAFQPPPPSGGTARQNLQTTPVVPPLSHPPLVLQPANYHSRLLQAGGHLQPLPSHSQSLLGSSTYPPPPPGFEGPRLRHTSRSAKDTGAVSGIAPPYESEHGSGSAAAPPHMAIPQATPPRRWPYPELSEPLFAGASLHLEGSGSRRRTHYGAYAEGVGYPPLPAAARPTGNSADEASTSLYKSTEGATYQHQEGEQEVEVEGLLAELLRGGLKYEDVFGTGKPPDQ